MVDQDFEVEYSAWSDIRAIPDNIAAPFYSESEETVEQVSGWHCTGKFRIGVCGLVQYIIYQL